MKKNNNNEKNTKAKTAKIQREGSPKSLEYVLTKHHHSLQDDEVYWKSY